MSRRAWREHDRRKCIKKRRWSTQAEAEQALAKMPQDRDAPRRGIYPCGDHWHIGRRPVKVDRSLYR